MTDRPLIGISAYDFAGSSPGYYLPRGYVDGVRAAGGRAVILPGPETDAAAFLDRVEGLVLSGGGDIAPERYGGGAHPSIYHVCDERDAFEIELAALALERGIPILSICRGLQVLNVALGGDLHPHVPEAFGERVVHRGPERDPVRHPTTVEAGSRLAEILATESLTVLSRHHQAANRIGRELRAVAFAEDGVIEALEHASHRFCVAVQWHPEMTLDDAPHRRLFDALVAACR